MSDIFGTSRPRQPSPRRGEGWSAVALFGLLVILLLIGGLVFGVLNAFHVQTMTCTVEDKDRTTVSDGDGGSKSDARVYTEQCGVLHVEDSILSWTFSSSDTYAKMKVGKTYHVKTRGHRVPFFSLFPNVVEAKEVSR